MGSNRQGGKQRAEWAIKILRQRAEWEAKGRVRGKEQSGRQRAEWEAVHQVAEAYLAGGIAVPRLQRDLFHQWPELSMV
jgi:hypothetical protein